MRSEEAATVGSDYLAVNREAWNRLAESGSDSSRPFGLDELAGAAAWIRPPEWLPWEEIRRVLILAGGGGQQGAVMAAHGHEVVVADASPEQLRRDEEAAAALGLAIECVQADMLDLSVLGGRTFDLVHQPISACYVPDVDELYRQVAGVLAPGGWYDVEHWNPVHVQLEGYGEWADGAYAISRPQGSGEPIPWSVADDGDEEPIVCWHYAHRLHDLIGGLCRAGFELHRLSERTHGDPAAAPGSHDHLAAYAPPFFRIVARFAGSH
jgi:SAM-dependent methyltransferase